MKQVEDVLKNYCSKGDTLIVGVSGGPDSVTLLNITGEFVKQNDCTVVVAHVNHGIRGKEADLDEEFVCQMAQVRNMVCEVKNDNLIGSGLEEKGRTLRREFFNVLREKHDAKYILTGHNSDDQVETILFNFLRGSGASGLAGMQQLHGGFLKPLLGVSREEIIQYIKEKELKCRTDESNFELKYMRNFIRHELVPRCKIVNSAFGETLVRNGEIFGQIDEWLKSSALDFLQQRIHFSLHDFKKLQKPVQRAVIQESYRSGTGSSYSLPLKKVMEVEKLLERNVGSKRIHCGGGGTFRLNKGTVYFEARAC